MMKNVFADQLHFEHFMLICGCILHICGLAIIVASGYTFDHHYAHIKIHTGGTEYNIKQKSSTETLAVIYPTLLAAVCTYTTATLFWIIKSKSEKYQTFHLLQINILTCFLFLLPQCYYGLILLFRYKLSEYFVPILVGFLLHWTILTLNVVIYTQTKWYQKHYISPHCLIQFTKMWIFAIFAGVP